jgi:hypothetical protein
MHACVMRNALNVKHNAPLNFNNVKLLKLNMNGFHFDNFGGDCAKVYIDFDYLKGKFCTYTWVYNTTIGYQW